MIDGPFVDRLREAISYQPAQSCVGGEAQSVQVGVRVSEVWKFWGHVFTQIEATDKAPTRDRQLQNRQSGVPRIRQAKDVVES